MNPKLLLRTAQAYLSLPVHPETLAPQHSPSLKLTLKPIFDASTGEAEAINIQLSFQSPEVAANHTLVELPLRFGNVPSQQYGPGAIPASDPLGDLPLLLKTDESNNLQRWLSTKATEGDVELAFTAIPRHVDVNTPIGSRVDLRKQHDGLLGVGLSMLPFPPTADEKYDIQIAWDLSSAPAGTSVASSLGEETLIRREGSLQDLQLSLFTVGPLKRYPPNATDSSDFGIFYCDPEPPFNIPELASYIQTTYSKISTFFGDEVRQPYRIFLRSSPRAVGGAGFINSFMLEYHHGQAVSQIETQDVLTHEIVHNWPLLDSQEKSRGFTGADVTWYNEGIATYYQAHLPYRFNISSRAELLRVLNSHAQAYYTNPTVNYSNEEAAEKARQDPNAQRLPYHRGEMYLTLVDCQPRPRSRGKQSIDGLVFELLQRRRTGQEPKLDSWLELVDAELGLSAIEDYKVMASGSLIVPPADCLTHLGLELFRHDQELFKLGFDSSPSFNRRKITGLLPGSRAEGAGIREGDEMVGAHTLHWQVTDDIERNMTLRLRRDGEVFDISYWPRSWRKVQSWQWRSSDVGAGTRTSVGCCVQRNQGQVYDCP